jgi:hypothetical protein
MSELPTVAQIRREHPGLTSRQVADMAGVPLRIEYLMEIGSTVSRQEADQVLRALSKLTGVHCTFQTVGGFGIKEECEQTQVMQTIKIDPKLTKVRIGHYADKIVAPS